MQLVLILSMSHRLLKYRLQVKLLFIMAIQKPPCATLAAGNVVNGITAIYLNELNRQITISVCPVATEFIHGTRSQWLFFSC
jgi:hypothetical protein